MLNSALFPLLYIGLIIDVFSKSGTIAFSQLEFISLVNIGIIWLVLFFKSFGLMPSAPAPFLCLGFPNIINFFFADVG